VFKVDTNRICYPAVFDESSLKLHPAACAINVTSNLTLIIFYICVNIFFNNPNIFLYLIIQQ